MKLFKTILLLFVTITTVGLISFKVSTANETSGKTEIKINETQSAKKLSVKFINQRGMVASWYGPKFNGKATATTEIFNQMAYTAAHKTLPFGTMLRLTNPKNGKSVIVRINDRGPYVRGRDIDLSRGAAAALGMVQKGVVKLNVEKIVLEESSNT